MSLRLCALLLLPSSFSCCEHRAVAVVGRGFQAHSYGRVVLIHWSPWKQQTSELCSCRSHSSVPYHTEPSLPRSVVWLPCITEDAQYVPFLENLLAKDRQLLQLDCSQQKAAQ